MLNAAFVLFCLFVSFRTRPATVFGELWRLEPLAPLTVAVAEKIFDAVRLPKRDFDFHQTLLTAFEMSQITEYDLFQRYDILESAGELFLVLKEQHRF